MQLKAKLRSSSGDVNVRNVSQCYDDSHNDREMVLAWNIFHMTLKRKIHEWLSTAKFLTSFVYFSEGICLFQAMNDIYSKSHFWASSVVAFAWELDTTDRENENPNSFWILEGIMFTMSRNLGEREVSQKNFRRKCKDSRQLSGSGFPDFWIFEFAPVRNGCYGTASYILWPPLISDKLSLPIYPLRHVVWEDHFLLVCDKNTS